VSRALDSRRVAEYRRRVSDPAYVARALAHVAGLLAEVLLPASRPGFRSLPRGSATIGDDSIGDPSQYN